MPSFRKNREFTKPWHARAKRMGLDISLGYYATWEEARERELQFIAKFPPDPRGSRVVVNPND